MWTEARSEPREEIYDTDWYFSKSPFLVCHQRCQTKFENDYDPRHQNYSFVSINPIHFLCTQVSRDGTQFDYKSLIPLANQRKTFPSTFISKTFPIVVCFWLDTKRTQQTDWHRNHGTLRGGVLHGSGEKNPIGPQMHKPMESVYKSMPKCRTNQVKSIKPGVFLSWIVTYKGKRLNKPRNRKKIFSPNRGRPRKPNKTDQKYHELYNSTRLVVVLNTSH